MRLFPIAAALTLAACGTAQSTQYFVLPDSQYIRPDAHGNEIAAKSTLPNRLPTAASFTKPMPIM